MFPRALLLFTLSLAVSSVTALAQSSQAPPTGCVAPLSSEEYGRLSQQEKGKYKLVDAGAHRGKYKPKYYELVGGTGECAGFYANPCGHDRASTEKVDSSSCDALSAIARSKKLKPVSPTAEQAQAAMTPKNKRKVEKISEGPDAGKYKPKYYEKTKEGLWASPCGHQGRSTELVDSNSCTDIQNLVRIGK